jgi:alkanesulfonate monooxygenase SsuD/methylene tetrahydromethanopterin reductase-like flavin-dependent oxidoreductase (luciferase family)
MKPFKIEQKFEEDHDMKFDILSLGDHVPQPEQDIYLDTQAERFALWIEMGRLGERLGFRGIQFGEHHDSQYIISSPHVVLAAIASQTKTIKLGTGVSLLANLDAVRFAEDFATLDLISGGRVEVGFGTGIEDSVFKLFGQDARNRNDLITENLALLQKLWSEHEVTWAGRFRTPIENFRLEPKTFTGRSIPIARGTGSLETAVKIGEAGHQILLPTMLGQFATLKGANDAYRDAYMKSGHDPRHLSASGVAYVFVGKETASARQYFEPFCGNYGAMVAREFGRHVMNPDIAKLAVSRTQRVIDLAFCGDAEEVAKGVLSAATAVGGLERMSCLFDIGGLPREDVLESIERFATEVIPIVLNELAGGAAKKARSFA